MSKDSLFTANYELLQAHEKLVLANRLLRASMETVGDAGLGVGVLDFLERLHYFERIQNNLGLKLEREIYANAPAQPPPAGTEPKEG